jgi:Lon protease-like protein
MSESAEGLSGFGGTVRLFPLPNLVLFPHVIQPLHIFEPRYRQLMEDALNADRLLALALLKPGWEEKYHQRPPIHPVVCIGRIFKEERLADGRFNLLLQGLCRARVLEEMKTAKLYRTARVDVLPEAPPSAAREPELRQMLGDQMGQWFAAHSVALDQMNKLLESNLSSGSLCDIFTFALPLDPEIKQALLEEAQVERRILQLVTHLASTKGPEEPQPTNRKFPPEFSPN